ncbi:hypothetical protein CAEBREN_10270 [Caenorhabditis brenneri]|uniref:Protein kinase domain-containing protein n=1 Tax=Caenorhabditis brenneri TaxID=135651 RepID=G0NN50_CAEBE|nr:hypothetical protein CAEBREN_10270 [Caenorhabditis brenneri]
MIVYFITKLYKLKKIRKELIVREVPDIKITNDFSKPLLSQKFKKDREAIDSRRVQVLQKLDSGNYGDIHLGLLEVGNSESEMKQIPILVKRISSSSTEVQKTMLLEELSVMRTVKPHPNVLCLVGVVLFKSEITEDAPFSLELLSPEAFEEWEFTEKSDVWAFAVCLFELFSLGKAPYDGVDDIQQFLRNGGRLAKPEYCSQETYTLMLNCWNFDPVIRPTFSQCVEFFAQILDSIDPQVCYHTHY